MKNFEEDIIRQHQQSYQGGCLDNCLCEERLGFPKALAALRSWSLKDLERERFEMLKASFDPLFGRNAKKMLNIIEQVIDERRMYSKHLLGKSTRLPKKPAKKVTKKPTRKPAKRCKK